MPHNPSFILNWLVYSSKEVTWNTSSLSILWLLVERLFDSNGTITSNTSGYGKVIVYREYCQYF